MDRRLHDSAWCIRYGTQLCLFFPNMCHSNFCFIHSFKHASNINRTPFTHTFNSPGTHFYYYYTDSFNLSGEPWQRYRYGVIKVRNNSQAPTPTTTSVPIESSPTTTSTIITYTNSGNNTANSNNSSNIIKKCVG